MMMTMMMKVISNLLALHFYVSSTGRLFHHLITPKLPNVHMYIFKFQIILTGFRTVAVVEGMF
jgi:hypothetical protein